MNAEVTFAILAGGQGRRLGGIDKGLMEVAGRKMVDWVLARMPEGQPGLIIANRNLDIYSKRGRPVVSDPWPESLGPLAGMLAALRASETDWVQILPCDGLLLPADLNQRLLLEALQSRCIAAYPASASQGQFLHVLLNRRIESQLVEAIECGERSVGRWLASIGASPLAVEEAAAPLIWSINTPSELRQAEEMLCSLEDS